VTLVLPSTIKRELKIMESTLFTTLTVTEEANLSGGTSYKSYKKYTPKKYDKKDDKKPSKFDLDLNLNIVTQVIAGNVIKDSVVVQNSEIINTNK
jgi:hypothetical protein